MPESIEVQFDVPNVKLGIGIIRDATVAISPPELTDLETVVFTEIRRQFTDNNLSEDTIVKSFRALYWSFGMDPTKERISSEALVRRILKGENMWRVNNAVDAMNVISAKYRLPIGVLNLDKIVAPIMVRKAVQNERFVKIGGKQVLCKGNEIVVADANKILDYGFATSDTDLAKVDSSARNILVLVYATSDVTDRYLTDALGETLLTIKRFAGGQVALSYVAKPKC